jgi:photoactive yellow protein
MDAEDRDALDLAAIQLDAEGHILTLNDAAYALPMFDRLRSKEDATDTAFFFDVAPSAATDAFYGRFHTGLEQEHLDARFPHLFTASSHPPFVALVHLFYDDGTETAWVLLRTA